MKDILRRRFAEPLLALLGQGVAPDRLALSVAIGVVIGNVPILGISTVLCAGIALAWRLNLVAIQLAQGAMAPTQLLLIVPFVRIGEWLTRSTPEPISVRADLALVARSPGQALDVLWRAGLHAGLAWSLIAPPVAFLLYLGLTPAFERAAARMKR
ncbi:MAG: DUF2062 domain-containing protein [Gammaproteobacteria bacterium]|nr:DUF2062 domain-containing protein [Gammaproteobacteria bacterium]